MQQPSHADNNPKKQLDLDEASLQQLEDGGLQV
jgi:hypothetical protein